MPGTVPGVEEIAPKCSSGRDPCTPALVSASHLLLLAPPLRTGPCSGSPCPITSQARRRESRQLKPVTILSSSLTSLCPATHALASAYPGHRVSPGSPPNGPAFLPALGLDGRSTFRPSECQALPVKVLQIQLKRHHPQEALLPSP